VAEKSLLFELVNHCGYAGGTTVSRPVKCESVLFRGIRLMRHTSLIVASFLVLGSLFVITTVSPAAVVDGLVVNYTFDDNTTSATLAADALGNHNGTLVDVGGPPAYSTGSQGLDTTDTHVAGAGALSFTGVSGYLQANDTSGSPLDTATGAGQARSLSFWFKTTDNTNLVVTEKGTNRHFVTQTFSPGTIGWRVYGSTVRTGVANDDAWHHFVGVHNAGQDTVYLDGVIGDSRANTAPGDDNYSLVLGARAGGSFAYSGKLDDVGIWNRNLDDTEIMGIYRAGLDGLGLAEARPWRQIKGTTYEYDPLNQWGSQSDFHNNYPDVQDTQGNWTKLVNGGINTPNYSDGTWVGCLEQSGDNGEPHPDLVFDLGQRCPLDEIRIIYMAGNYAGINPPDAVDVAFSDDGVNFSTPIAFTPFPPEGPWGTDTLYVDQVFLDVWGQWARYVQLDFYQDNQWTFLGEIQFSAVPEPGSLLLLALGSILLVPLAQRRRKE